MEAALARALLALLIAYLLGALSGSLLLGRLRGFDIRAEGSGNAGGTNAFRTRGWRFAVPVVLFDVGKGTLAAFIGVELHDDALPLSPRALGFAAVLAAAIGHSWPVWFGFRGGKGVATLLGGLLWLWPLAVPLLLAVWLLLLGSSGYVGLASLLATASLLPLGWLRDDPAGCGFGVAALALVLITHRSNLGRLLAGREHRFERARVIARWMRR